MTNESEAFDVEGLRRAASIVDAYHLCESSDKMRSAADHIEALENELDNCKWHDTSHRLPPSNEEVDIYWNGLELVGHINSFNAWWINDTPLDEVSDASVLLWRFRTLPKKKDQT